MVSPQSIGDSVDPQHMVYTMFKFIDQPDKVQNPEPPSHRPNGFETPDPPIAKVEPKIEPSVHENVHPNPNLPDPSAGNSNPNPNPAPADNPSNPNPTHNTPNQPSAKVWEGNLTWRDNMQEFKKFGYISKYKFHERKIFFRIRIILTEIQINCEISCSRDHNSVAVNAQTWPEVLIVKFIPQNLLQKLKEFFANSIWMTFNFGQNAEKTALYSLYEQLTKVFLI